MIGLPVQSIALLLLESTTSAAPLRIFTFAGLLPLPLRWSDGLAVLFSSTTPALSGLFIAIAWRATSEDVMPNIGAKMRLSGPAGEPLVRRAVTFIALGLLPP